MGEAEDLLRALRSWQKGDDLRPLLDRTVRLVGPQIIVDLPTDDVFARKILERAVLDYLERGGHKDDD